jgi:hypothetical protein
MSAEIVGVLVVLMCVMIVAASTRWRRARQTALALDLLQNGTLTMGKIVAINRPFATPGETHVYFSYEVPGVGTFVRSCSIDVRALRVEHGVLIPTVGSQVTVRYLPHAPEQALLPQLLPCLVGFQAARAHPQGASPYTGAM